MGQDVKKRSRICPLPPGPLRIGLSTNTDSKEMVAASLILIVVLSASTFATSLFMVPVSNERHSFRWSAYAAIAIDGDANFSDTALLEGWPGDGSPENPFIIDGLNIDSGGAIGHGISIINTRVNFIIRNCNLTGFWSTHGHTMCLNAAGIYMENVTNGELVNNTCNGNSYGIDLWDSYSNTLVNNTCNNSKTGISLEWSNSNTLVNNICSNNTDIGIYFYESCSNSLVNNICSNNTWNGIVLSDITFNNTVVNNNCNNNRIGIIFYESKANTVADNTCNSNAKYGLFFYESHQNTVDSNTCTSNGKDGIRLSDSDHNTVADNTCSRNNISISLEDSDSNTVANNTCNSNNLGIWLFNSHQNTVVNNTCLNNTEHDILVESETEEFDPTVLLLIGFVGITLLGAGWKFMSGKREFNETATG